MSFRCKSFALCLTLVLVSSLFVCVFVGGCSGASLENAVHVKNEEELKNAINSVTSNKVTIALDNDISLIDNIVISANKDVTLTSNRGTGFYKLIGASDETFGVDYSKGTIVVVEGGVLRVGGVIVTHVNDGWGSGVVVSGGGQLFMYGGEISGNSAVLAGYWGSSSGLNSYGGGVQNFGVFELHGGKISNNIADSGFGGGVYNKGTFKMFGGEISDNYAAESTSTGGFGGGVFNDAAGSFVMSGGTISNNKAIDSGGGVCNYGIFERLGGVISDNTASNGNDIYSNDNGGGSSNGNNNGGGSGSGGNGGGSGSGGNGGGLSNGGFGLRDVVFLCVGVVVVVVGVVVCVLFFTVKKKVAQVEAKLSVISGDEAGSKH